MSAKALFVDGHDVRDVDLVTLRKQIGIVRKLHFVLDSISQHRLRQTRRDDGRSDLRQKPASA